MWAANLQKCGPSNVGVLLSLDGHQQFVGESERPLHRADSLFLEGVFLGQFGGVLKDGLCIGLQFFLLHL
jgi:hypothetical protein